MANQAVAPFERCCGELQSRLEDACSGRQVTEAWIGALDRERTYGAATGQVSGAAPFVVDVACLAKVLTATLICSSIGESKIALADEVLSYLPSTKHSSTALRGSHHCPSCLNHTHWPGMTLSLRRCARGPRERPFSNICQSGCRTTKFAPRAKWTPRPAQPQLKTFGPNALGPAISGAPGAKSLPKQK